MVHELLDLLCFAVTVFKFFWMVSAHTGSNQMLGDGGLAVMAHQSPGKQRTQPSPLWSAFWASWRGAAAEREQSLRNLQAEPAATGAQKSKSSCPESVGRAHKPYLPLYGAFPGGSDGKESACSAGDLGLILGWEDPLEKEMATHSGMDCLGKEEY